MTKTYTAAESLYRETEAARTLLAQYEEVLGDDTQAKADMVEGETNLKEAITKGLARIIEIDAMEAALSAIMENVKARMARLDQQRSNLKTALGVALEIAEVRKLETPLATVSLRNVAPKVEIVDESQIPSRFWKPSEPKLDRKAVLAALNEKEVVPGAVLSNGGVSVAVTQR